MLGWFLLWRALLGCVIGDIEPFKRETFVTKRLSQRLAFANQQVCRFAIGGFNANLNFLPIERHVDRYLAKLRGVKRKSDLIMP